MLAVHHDSVYAARERVAPGGFSLACKRALPPSHTLYSLFSFTRTRLAHALLLTCCRDLYLQVGVGALVLNAANEILLVQERRGPAARPGFWKMPTGLVDVGEAVGAAAAREVSLQPTAHHLPHTGLRLLHRRVLSLLSTWSLRPACVHTGEGGDGRASGAGVHCVVP